MNPLFLTDGDIAELVSVQDGIDALERACRQQTTGEASHVPRQRVASGGAFLHMLAGSIPGYFGYKAYVTGPGGVGFLFFLFDSAKSKLVAIMEADRLGQTRTGAATGVATLFLAAEEVSVATIIGAGWQAESQLVAMDAVRALSRVWVVNRSPERAREFIEKMAAQVQAELVPAEDAEAAVRESRLVTTITNSREPVLFGAWVEPGTHVNAAGGNMLLRREVDTDLVVRADRLVVDSVDQARLECGEFLPAMVAGKRHWDEVLEMKDVVAGAGARRKPEEITLFKSLGLGLQDLALGALAYQRASERGVGRALEM